MLNFVLLCLFLLPTLSVQADLKILTTELKTKKKVEKISIKKIKPEKKIKDAVIWHSPKAKYLSKKFSYEQKEIINRLSMKILLEALAANDEKFSAAQKSIGKKTVMKNLLESLLKTRINRSDYQSEDYIYQKTQDLRSNYLSYIKIYEATPVRDEKKIARAMEARSKLEADCSRVALLELDKLWQRDQSQVKKDVYVSKLN